MKSLSNTAAPHDASGNAEIELIAIERNVLPHGPAQLRSQAVLLVGRRTVVVPIRATIMHRADTFRRHVFAVLGIIIADPGHSDDRWWLRVVAAAEGGTR